MGVVVRYYEERDAEAWDDLVAGSWNGTFLHTRGFLSYHGERFQDLSLVVEDERGHVRGVFPAALDPEREDLVVSHPGLTYGGVVHDGSLRGAAMIETLRAVVEAYRKEGFKYLRYKAVPYIYHKIPADDDLYALFRLGARRYRCDLSASISLDSHRGLNRDRRKNLNRAQRRGVQVASGPDFLKPFWTIVEENLSTKYGVRPVHTLEEITYLHTMFPDQIECIAGTLGDEVVAGMILFRMPQVAHVQYSSATPTGQDAEALTVVTKDAIERSRDSGTRYFDFGISNEKEGKILNEGLYKFKTGFGAGGIVHEVYELEVNHGCAQAH